MSQRRANKTRTPATGKASKTNTDRTDSSSSANPSPRAQETTPPRRTTILLCVLLSIGTLLIYAPVGGHSFIDYDDDVYVFANPHVASGLSDANLLWACRSGYAANWHPLTWVSHMLDCQIFGAQPGPQHLVSVFFHVANTMLLFLVLSRMTASTWRSAMVAALFAFHPQHVESVAWIAERKDVLSAFFCFLTLLAYHAYATRPTHARYLATAFFLALGLMSKPMLVTLPCLLLLLDYWPLNRLHSTAQLKTLLLEKTPFLALSAAMSVITFLVQKSGGAVATTDGSDVFTRLGQALNAYFFYLGKLLWPHDLFVPYWYDYHPEFWRVAPMIGALAFLAFLTFEFGRRHPYVPVGLLWFFGMLVPVIGLIQVGSQSAADRYTYLPSIGIFIFVTWGSADLLASWRVSRWVTALAATIVIGICGILTERQISYWKNNETLFQHTLAIDPPNLLAMETLAWGYATDPIPTLRNGARALELASFCVQITQRREPTELRALAAAYAETHQFALATATAEEALRLFQPQQFVELWSGLQTDLECYRAGRAIRAP